MKGTFNWFLITYLSKGHTLTIPAIQELNELTNEFLDELSSESYFTTNAVLDYLEFLNDSMSEGNKHFFNFEFDKWRYIEILEDWIRTLIESQN